MSNFQVISMPANPYQELFKLNAEEMKAMGVQKVQVAKKPGYPCRISLQDAEVGEEVLLLPYYHHEVTSPYRARGPVFIRKDAREAHLAPNALPKMLSHRQLSLRAYDPDGIMVEAGTVMGENVRGAIQKIFKNHQVSYIHVHNAGPGCFNCQINRLP